MRPCAQIDRLVDLAATSRADGLGQQYEPLPTISRVPLPALWPHASLPEFQLVRSGLRQNRCLGDTWMLTAAAASPLKLQRIPRDRHIPYTMILAERQTELTGELDPTAAPVVHDVAWTRQSGTFATSAHLRQSGPWQMDRAFSNTVGGTG